MGVAEVVATLRADTSDFTAKLGAAKAEVDKLGKTGSSNFDKLASVGKAALLGIGAAAVGVGVASVDLADKYQSATNTIAANGDISVASANKIGKAFLATGGTTIYSAQQIAGAFGAVAGQVKLMNGGVLNAKAAMEVMRPAMDLAEASGQDLATTTSDITKTLQAFGLNIKDSPLVANVLFNAARDTGTSVDTLSQQIDKMKAKMGDTAPPINQMGGLLVDLTEHGETGRAAMTALGSAFTGIVSPTKAVTAAQQQMGVSFVQANGQLLPMDQIIGELAPKIAGMGNAQAAATLKALGFGSAATKLVGVIQAGPKAFDAATAAVQRQNSAHEAAEKQAKTFSHQIETLKAGLEDEGVKIGQALIPKLQDLLNITMKVVEWFEHHRVAAEVLAGVIGGALLTAIAAYTVSMISAAAATIAATWPILLIIAAVAAVAVGIYELADHWKTVWNDVIGPVVHGAWDIIGPIFNLIKQVMGVEIVAYLTVLKGAWTAVWTVVSSVIQTVWGIIGPIFNLIKTIVGVDITTSVNVLRGAWQAAWGAIVAVLQLAWAGINQTINAGIQIFYTIPSKIIAAFAGAGSWLFDAGVQIVKGLENGISSQAGPLSGVVHTVIQSPISTALQVLGINSPSKVFQDIGMGIMEGLALGITDHAHLATGAVAAATGSLGTTTTLNAGISPIITGGATSSTSGSAPVYLQINGQTFATLVLPALQTAALQAQRGQSLPVFGTTQTAAA